MRAILVDNDYNNMHAFNRKLELSSQHINAEYSNTIVARQRPETLLHSINKTVSPQEMRLCLPSQKGFTIVKLEEIIYCEAQRSYTQFHFLNSKSITVSKPLFDYDKILAGTTFLRVHKSFFVNLLHVKEYTRGEGGTVTMANGMEIDVSRRKKEQFLIKIKEFFKY